MINNKILGEGLYSMVWYSARREMEDFPCNLEIESFVCVFGCKHSHVQTVWPLTLIFGMEVNRDLS